MKHLKKFNTTTEYDQFKSGSEFVLPNVSYVVENTGVAFSPYVEPPFKMIDLGLPSGTLWADRNVGAASPEDYGLYFQWGDTVGCTPEQIFNGERTFDYSSYFDKYNPDGLTVLEALDDAATVHMGPKYRMPTDTDYKELMNNCTVTFIDLNDNEFNQSEANIAHYNLKGIKLTGSNGNFIFIPAYSDIYRSYTSNYKGSVGDL